MGRVCGMPDSVALTVLLQSYVEPCTQGVLLSCRTIDMRHDPGGGGAGGGVGPAVAVMHRPSPVLSSVSLKAQVWVGGLAGSQAASFTSPVPSTVRHLARGEGCPCVDCAREVQVEVAAVGDDARLCLRLWYNQT